MVFTTLSVKVSNGKERLCRLPMAANPLTAEMKTGLSRKQQQLTK